VATNVDLRQLVKEGKFRSDLYYRLNAFQINIPPVRERREDVLPLAKRFLEKYSAVRGKKLLGFTDKAKRALLAYPWPGNIREMQNVVERGVILAPSGTRIELEQMFSASSGDHALEFGLNDNGGLGLDRPEPGKDNDLYESVLNGSMTLDQAEATLIEAAVKKAGGNLSAAARVLGLTRPQLAYRLARLHTSEPERPEIAFPPANEPGVDHQA
jgi:transcriptional regulator with GAF, ATPase, and Fis domain